MAPKRHKHLSHNHLRDTQTSSCLQQNIKKKCLLCLHEKLAIITYLSQNTLLNKKSEILSKCKHLTLRPIHITHLTPLLIKKKKSNDTTPHLKHRKYHFPPPTITLTTMYVPSFSINPHTLLHTPPLSVKIIISWALIIGLNTLHSSYLPRTLYLLLQYRIIHITLTQNG